MQKVGEWILNLMGRQHTDEMCRQIFPEVFPRQNAREVRCLQTTRPREEASFLFLQCMFIHAFVRVLC